MRRTATRLILSLGLPAALGGCGGILDPQGPIGASERLIMFNAFGIMMVVIIPVILMTLGFAWWFRAGNTKATYSPDWEYSGQIEMVVWAVPAMIVILVGGVAWISSHDLDPQRPIASANKPLQVQVVSLNWKWLFIYPEQGVASVNELTVPAGTPVEFTLTSYTVMTAFLVPQLGGMIYTMPGMATRLHLQADKPGDYPGLASHYSGNGFSDMRFIVHSIPADQFAGWVERTKGQATPLDDAALAKLAENSTAKPQLFKDAGPNVFGRIMLAATQPAGSPGAPGIELENPGKEK